MADITIPASFLQYSKTRSRVPALLSRDPESGSVTTTSYHTLRDAVLDAAAVLLENGVEHGDRVCVHVPTSPAHTVWDLAILCVGAVAVPIYDTDSVEQIEWILTDSDPVVLVGSPALLETSWQAHANIAHRSVIVDVGTRAAARQDDEVLRRTEAVTGSDLAGIIYTSGTTGHSKGCKLSHGAFAQAVGAAKDAFADQFSEGQRTLLFLPLAHVFARVVQYVCVTSGVEIAYSAPQTVAEDVLWAQPEWMVTVPRVLEKVHAGAQTKATGVKALIFRQADRTAQAFAQASETGRVSALLRLRRSIFDHLVYAKIRAALGGKLTTVVSGGAALDPRLDRFFTGCGITVYEGYGLTETSAAHCANTPDQKRAGTVGKPLGTFEMRIDDEGEVLLRGENLFSGYWNNTEASQAAMRDGWFCTGDLGSIDADGFLTITGRRKEIIVTSNGKNVQPAGLEELVTRSEIVSQCVVIGDGRQYIAALVVVDPTWAERRANELSVSVETVLGSDEVRVRVQDAIDTANASVSRAEAIKAFRILPEELTTQNGLLTPTLKVKRPKVAERFASVIEEMYRG